jgi:opacity protein-like surface antigen
MRHNIIIIAACLLSALGAAAHDNYFTSDHHVTIEVGIGPTLLPAHMGIFEKNKQGIDGYAEVRYRLADVPIDFGLYFGLDILTRYTSSEGDYDFTAKNVMLTTDYNWRVGKFFTAFAGFGVGRLKNDPNYHSVTTADGTKWSDERQRCSFAFMPRVGITAFSVLRLTAGYKFENRVNRHAFITLGLTFSGMGSVKR